MNCTFNYGITRVRDLSVSASVNDRTRKTTVHTVTVEGRPMRPSKRFWNSFFTRFGFSDTVFKYFDHHEVFQRISQRAPDDLIRFCVETDAEGKQTLLAVSNPKRPVVQPTEIFELVHRYDGERVNYGEGVVTSFHVPSSGDGDVQIGPDGFKHRFTLETPIDGYGNPRVFLALIRLICSNGAIAYTPAFRSEIRVGKDTAWSIARALESYDNGEGYAALRQRFESAQRSWASLNECHRLYRALVKLHASKDVPATAPADFARVTGNLNELYGLANLDALSVKRQRILPAKCRVYDLLNFTSELATHRASPLGSRVLQAHLGTMIADEYDMEGTAENVKDFSDFFVPREEPGPAPSMN